MNNLKTVRMDDHSIIMAISAIIGALGIKEVWSIIQKKMDIGAKKEEREENLYTTQIMNLTEKINQLEFSESQKLLPFADKVYNNDIDFKNDVKAILGNKLYSKNDGAILEAATTINATLILIGILGFIACFAFSLGPVMWVLLSELYPLKYRGLAIGIIAFINSLISSLVQLVFPWELSNLGNALTFFIFGIIALVGFFVLVKILPETKGKSLEELELELVKS